MPKEKTRQRKYHEKMLAKGLRYIHVYVPAPEEQEFKRMARHSVEQFLMSSELEKLEDR